MYNQQLISHHFFLTFCKVIQVQVQYNILWEIKLD